MKIIKIYSLCAFMLLLFDINPLMAQRGTYLQGIEYNSFVIKKGNSEGVKLGDAAGSIVQKFGTPTLSEPYYYEIGQKMAKIIKYGENNFFEADGKFDGFTITSNLFLLGMNGNYIKVGDNFNKVKALFADAHKYQEGNTFYIPLLYNGKPVEGTYLIIALQPQTYEIETIMQWEAG